MRASGGTCNGGTIGWERSAVMRTAGPWCRGEGQASEVGEGRLERACGAAREVHAEHVLRDVRPAAGEVAEGKWQRGVAFGVEFEAAGRD